MGIYIHDGPFNKVIEQSNNRNLVIDGECREVTENISIGFEIGEPANNHTDDANEER